MKNPLINNFVQYPYIIHILIVIARYYKGHGRLITQNTTCFQDVKRCELRNGNYDRLWHLSTRKSLNQNCFAISVRWQGFSVSVIYNESPGCRENLPESFVRTIKNIIKLLLRRAAEKKSSNAILYDVYSPSTSFISDKGYLSDR